MKNNLNKKKYKLISNPFLDDKDIIEKLSDPNYEGNLGLPLNPTPLQVAKYNICQSILHYKFDKEISTEKLAKQIRLSVPETKELLFCHIHKFTLDRLFSYAANLTIPLQITETKEKTKRNILLRSKTNNSRLRKHS
jgi:hypothetical protein